MHSFDIWSHISVKLLLVNEYKGFLCEAGAEDATWSRTLFSLKLHQPAFTRKDEHAVFYLKVISVS